MNQQVLKNYTLVKKTKNTSVFKSNNNKSIIILHSDGNVEGIYKNNNIDENIIKEINLRQMFESIILVSLSLSYFTTDITIVDGVSMEPTYSNLQLIIKSSILKQNKFPITKDTIVKFKSPEGDTSIKRIVGVPGDVLEFYRATVKVNGKVIDDDNREYQFSTKYKSKSGKYKFLPPKQIKLSSNQYFVMGDNKEASIDSRHYGPIDKSAVLSVIDKK